MRAANKESAASTSKKKLSAHVILLGAILILSAASDGLGQDSGADLTKVSLEDLMNIKVTSVSRKEEKLSRSPTAIYVITPEMIRRSGARNIPDILRMVPGLEVAQITANTWAITARGFNGQFSNKLLVLMDGRTVYDPSNSGVYWDAQDIVLADIARIEVIRGPGATIWGTNAVNGVINIITKTAKDTQGGYLTAGGGGSVEQGFGTVRYGGAIGTEGHYRVFGKYFSDGSTSRLSGQNAADGWKMERGGFRTDWDLSSRTSATVQGDIYGGVEGQPYPAPPLLTPPFAGALFSSIKDIGGGDLEARWNHTLQGGSQMSLQTYFDRVSRTDSVDPELLTTFDVDFQDHLSVGGRHDIVWGFGYRRNADHLGENLPVSFIPSRFVSSIANTFVQDEINLAPARLWLTVGTKIEHNSYTSGVDVEPSVRLLWTPNSRDSLWLAYSRATRIPARNDRNLSVDLAAFPGPDNVVALLTLSGNPRFPNEALTAYELGYRSQVSKRVSLDVATFYNDYSHLRDIETGVPFFATTPSPPHLVIPGFFDGKMYGVTYGAESSVDWKATNAWLLSGGYTWFVPSLKLPPSSTGLPSLLAEEGGAPRNQFQFRSQYNLPRGFEFDTALYNVGRLATGSIPAYDRVDVRIGRQVSERAELSVVGQNLLTPQHLEFQSLVQSFASTEAKRSIYGMLTWRF